MFFTSMFAGETRERPGQFNGALSIPSILLSSHGYSFARSQKQEEIWRHLSHQMKPGSGNSLCSVFLELSSHRPPWKTERVLHLSLTMM
jgi:hypothetical protein